MEARKFKLQYFSRTARYLHSVKSVDTPAIGTFISTPHAKMTPDPPPYRLNIIISIIIVTSIIIISTYIIVLSI